MSSDLQQRLAEGPGSRELSDEFLLAMGWGHFDPKSPVNMPEAWVAPNGDLSRPDERPNPCCSVDDALAMVPESMGYDVGTAGVDKEGRRKYHAIVSYFVFEQGRENYFVAKSYSAPCAICLAILRTKEKEG